LIINKQNGGIEMVKIKNYSISKGKLIIFTWALLVLLILVPFGITAQESGKIGNLSWNFKDSILTISGVGKMPDEIGEIIAPSPPPVFKPGEKIAEPKEIIFPLECKSVIIEEGVTSIGMAAFTGCKTLNSVVIPKSVTSIGLIAFIGCTNITSVEVKSTTPPKLEIEPLKVNPFGPDLSSIILSVPKGAKAAYTSADGWKNFKNIKEI